MAIDWMEGLEERVREAAQEIRRLRAERDQLSERLAAIESGQKADTAWEQEREEVRRRVERLVAQLEGLIRDAETSEA